MFIINLGCKPNFSMINKKDADLCSASSIVRHTGGWEKHKGTSPISFLVHLTILICMLLTLVSQAKYLMTSRNLDAEVQ